MSIDYKKEGSVAIFTINNPDVMNALSPAQLEDWTETLTDFRDDANLLVGIVTGTGEKSFCTGMNISDAIQNKNKVEFFPENTFVRGMEIWKPIIAAINGYAFGGGLEIALACDIRIASENALLGLPEVSLGLIPGWGGTQRLQRIVPFGIAMEMVLTGRKVSALEALDIGLVHKVVSIGDLMVEANLYAEKLCELAPLAVRGAKEAILKGGSMTLEDGLALEKTLGKKIMASEDFSEGCEAFLNKRKPIFKGE